MSAPDRTADRYAILDALLGDGFDLASSADAADVSRAIQRAARAGTLVWTSEEIRADAPVRIGTRGRVVALEPATAPAVREGGTP